MKTNAAIGADALARIKNRLWSLPTALILIWCVVLIWGEHYVFQRSINQCQWQQWESWPLRAEPHHVLLVADPQLVDPHTYPGRPWPLSTLTVFYTDIYLRRAYRSLQRSLRPDATLFLGDLFDGGREWGTQQSSSPEDRYKKYGTRFWLKEYIRFSNIFLRSWTDGAMATSAEPAGRRLVASVPGNHDLGFATGIQPAVKSRFDAYFGPLNRVDVIGNHSFVSLDTVSLSAMDQVDPETGSSGAGDGSAAITASTKIWKPVEDFLIQAKSTRAKAIQHTCETQFEWKSPRPAPLYSPNLRDAETSKQAQERDVTPQLHAEVSSAGFPTIVLSHVPLYRTGATSCGPMRERGTAIPLHAGYQYQNVLTPLISQDIVKHLRQEEVTQIYSGDDHDYCEIEHGEFTGRPKEITVKSMSWAMGVRVPGVQLVSLWNPVDCERVMSGEPDLPTPRDTVQNHLCLLPNQLSIFIRYVQTFGLTIIALLVLAIRYKPSSHAEAHHHHHEKTEPLLPLSKRQGMNRPHTSSTSSAHNDHGAEGLLSTRKLGGYGQLPFSSRSASPSKPPYHDPSSHDGRQDQHPADNGDVDDYEDWGMPRTTSPKMRRPPPGRLEYFGRSLWQVAWPVLLLYLWLFWKG